MWEENLTAFTIYSTLRNYTIDYALDTAILIELIKDSGQPVTQLIRSIPYIHKGYCTLAKEETSNGRETTED